MQVNANQEVALGVLKKANDINKNQVNNLLQMQQTAQEKIRQDQSVKVDTAPKSNIIGSLFDKRV